MRIITRIYYTWIIQRLEIIIPYYKKNSTNLSNFFIHITNFSTKTCEPKYIYIYILLYKFPQGFKFTVHASFSKNGRKFAENGDRFKIRPTSSYSSDFRRPSWTVDTVRNVRVEKWQTSVDGISLVAYHGRPFLRIAWKHSSKTSVPRWSFA